MAPHRYNLSLIAANILFGVSYSIIVSLLEAKLSVQQLFIMQIVAGAAIFLTISLFTGGLQRIKLATLPSIIIYTLILLYGWCYLTLIGGKSTTPLSMAALSTLGPAVTILAGAIESGQRREREFEARYCNSTSCVYYPRLKQVKPRRIQMLALPVTFLLLVFISIIHNTPAATSSAQRVANLVVTVAVICFSASTTIVRHLKLRIGTIPLLTSLYCTALLLIPIVIPDWLNELHAMESLHLAPHEVAGLLYLPTLGTALPLYLLYHGSSHLTPLRTALFRYLQPVIAVIVLFAQQGSDGGAILVELRHLAVTLSISLLLLVVVSILLPRWGGGYRATS